MAPPPTLPPKMAPPPENGTNHGTNHGTAADLAAKNGTTGMTPLPKVGGVGGGNTPQTGTAMSHYWQQGQRRCHG